MKETRTYTMHDIETAHGTLTVYVDDETKKFIMVSIMKAGILARFILMNRTQQKMYLTIAPICTHVPKSKEKSNVEP